MRAGLPCSIFECSLFFGFSAQPVFGHTFQCAPTTTHTAQLAMEAPAGWGTPPTATTTASAQPSGFILKIFVNALTAITTVGLPFYDRNQPMEGTKPARESFRKLLTQACAMTKTF